MEDECYGEKKSMNFFLSFFFFYIKINPSFYFHSLQAFGNIYLHIFIYISETTEVAYSFLPECQLWSTGKVNLWGGSLGRIPAQPSVPSVCPRQRIQGWVGSVLKMGCYQSPANFAFVFFILKMKSFLHTRGAGGFFTGSFAIAWRQSLLW